MQQLLKSDAGLPPLRTSDKIFQADICRLSGARPGPLTPERTPEWFLQGTEPADAASTWFTRDPAGQIRPVLPPEYAAWCRSPQNHLGALCPGSEQLAIVQPRDRASYALDPDLPRSQQMLELTTNTPAQPVRWSVNDSTLPTPSSGRTYWPLAPGAWRIRAQAGEQAAEVAITVE
jgi:hypothetical protein